MCVLCVLCLLCLCLHFQIAFAERLHGFNEFEAQLLPPDCHGGLIELDGKYRTEMVEYHNDCTLSGAPGTEVEVFGEIHFLQNAKLQGSITFHGVKGPRGPTQKKHRCVDVEGSLEFVEPNVEFINCGSEDTDDGGGFYVEGEVILREGRVVARGCKAQWGGGGFIGEGLKVSGGSMLFQDCEAGMDGGGLLLKKGSYQQSGTSNVTFVNCSAFHSGGGMGLWTSNFTQHAGHLSFQKCVARHGGGIYVNGSFHQSGGLLEGMDCAASTMFGSGGLISAVEVFLHGQIYANGCAAGLGGCIAGNVNITGGLKIRHCFASFLGGAMFGSDVSLQGEISIMNCSAGAGGAIYSKGSVVIENATVYLQDTVATKHGAGAIYAGNVKHKNGKLHVKSSWSKKNGGAIATRYFFQTGFASFTSCASEEGGALFVLNYDISGSSIFENCSASIRGGAIFAIGLVRQRYGLISFHQCRSQGIGGAVFAMHLTQRGHLRFSNCWARHKGGAIATMKGLNMRMLLERAFPGQRGEKGKVNDQIRGAEKGTVVLDGSCEFHTCLAAAGGAVSSPGLLLKQNGSAIFEDCHAEGSAGALVGDQIVLLGNATFHNISMGVIQSTGSVQLVSPVMQKTSGTAVPQISAMKEIDISDVLFENTSSVWFSAPHIHVKNIQCDNGLQSFMDSAQVGCKTCEENRVQFSGGPVLNDNGTVKRCVLAPRGTAKIGFDHLRLKMGYMTEIENITRSFRCPNRMACIGGMISTHGWGEMCAPGYEGRGCFDCASSYAVSDINSFICLKCASSQWQQMFQMARFFLQDFVLFGLSAMGISSGTSKDSTILINHFMSFVAAAGPVLEVVRDTPTFKQTGKTVDDYVEGFSSTMEVGETSSGGSGMSASCILSYLKLPQALWSRSLIILFTPISATVALTLARGWRMAAVVGVNCFLPKACLCFARYLACFRMEPEDEGGQLFCLSDIYTNFSYLTLVAVISSIAFAGPAIWSVLLRDDENKNAAFFLYLTGPYKEQLRSWEVTRLVRKAALAIISAALPISLHPATQIMCISFILLGALVLETQMQPYREQHWNMEEKVLLTVSLALVSVTSCYMANENSWSSTHQSQCILLFTIFTLCILPSNVMICLIIRQLLRERGICVQN